MARPIVCTAMASAAFFCCGLVIDDDRCRNISIRNVGSTAFFFPPLSSWPTVVCIVDRVCGGAQRSFVQVLLLLGVMM